MFANACITGHFPVPPALRNGKATFDEIMEPFFSLQRNKTRVSAQKCDYLYLLVVTWGSVDL